MKAFAADLDIGSPAFDQRSAVGGRRSAAAGLTASRELDRSTTP